MATTTPRPFRAVVLVAALLFAAPTAHAADPAAQAAGAALFQEAKQLASAGDYEHACPKFVEAQRLFPTAGTLLNIGNCYEKLGKFASAWGAFKEAEVMARTLNDADREQEASRRAQAAALRMAKLAIVVPPAVRVPGFEVRRDGMVIGEGQWGSPMPVDTGRHTIEATASGRKPWSTTVRIDAEGSSASVDVPVLEAAQIASPAVASDFWNTRRTAGVVVGSFGLAGALTGAITGGLALARASSAKPQCQPLGAATACDPTGLSLRSDGRHLANAANVTLALGGSAIVAGVVLFATAPDGASKSAGVLRVQAGPTLGGAGTGFSVDGAW